MTYSVSGIVMVSCLVITFLLFHKFLQNTVEALEALVPEPPVLPHPLRRLPQARRLETARPPLGAAALGDQPGALQHLQVFADTGKAEVERLGQLRDRRLAL